MTLPRCGGGLACTQYNADGTRAPVRTLLRDTSVFNSYMMSKVQLDGQFEAGKVGNSFRRYEAEGVKWLVLSMELWPRQQVLDWTKTVVASNPTYNVIIVTHSLLNSDRTINTTNGGYGSTTSQAIYDQLILAYLNVKMAFSGHVKGTANRVDTGVNGNKVVTFLTCFHSNDFNPSRFLTVDVLNDSVSSQIRYSTKLTGSTAVDPNYQQYDAIVSGLSFIRS